MGKTHLFIHPISSVEVEAGKKDAIMSKVEHQLSAKNQFYNCVCLTVLNVIFLG